MECTEILWLHALRTRKNNISFIVLETYQVCYTVIFIAFEIIFILSRFSVSLKSLNDYFIRRFPSYKSVLNRFSVLINCIMWSFNRFSTSSCFPRFSDSRIFRVQVFQGPGFSESRFFRVKVQGPGPGFRSSQEVQDPYNTAYDF